MKLSKPSAISERHLQQAVRQLFHNHQYILVNSFVFNWESDLFSVTKSGNVYEVEMKISKADYRKDFEKEKHQLFQSNIRGATHHIFKGSGDYVWDKEGEIGRFSYQEVHWQYPEGYYYDYQRRTHITDYGKPLFRMQHEVLRAPCTSIKIKPLVDILCPNRFYYACPPGIIEVKDLPPYAGLIHVDKEKEAIIIKQAPLMHKRYLLDEKMAKKLLQKFWHLSQNQRYHLQRNNINYKDSCEPDNSEIKTGPEGQ